jgi:predicted alpha-1,2-mannosidase
MMQSMVAQAQQCGALPKWSQNNNEMGIMTGYAGPTIIASTYAFGATHFDTRAALSFMVRSVTGSKVSCNGGVLNSEVSQFLSAGYTKNPSESLEDASMEFAVSQYAHALKDTNAYMATLKNSALWRKSFNVSTGYIQMHNSDGSWADLKQGSPNGYTEGNPAQYTLMVPFDLGTLVQLMSQSGDVLSRLDDYFSQLNAGESNPNLYIGNEPDFGDPWVYNWAKKPSSAQKVVHNIIQREFTTDPGGLPGNDDLGAMSAWLVWADLGMYPEIPGVGGFALNTPAFPNMTLKLGNGRTVRVTSSGAPSYYIQQMTLNGARYNRTWLPLSALGAGGTVKYTLGPKPSTWGTGPNTAPPSYHLGTVNGISMT